MIGEFEYLLLAAAIRLGDEAYGVSIREDVEASTGRPCSISALYTTLDRRKRKGASKHGWARRPRSAGDGPNAWFA